MPAIIPAELDRYYTKSDLIKRRGWTLPQVEALGEPDQREAHYTTTMCLYLGGRIIAAEAAPGFRRQATAATKKKVKARNEELLMSVPAPELSKIYVCKSDLKTIGWTDSLINALLPLPCAARRNDYGNSIHTASERS